MRRVVEGLRGLAILDNDGRERTDTESNDLKTVYWRRYEAENYFITPAVLKRHAVEHYADSQIEAQIDEVLEELILEHIFSGEKQDYHTWRNMDPKAGHLFWETKTERIKMSDFAEGFFRSLAARLEHPMLLKKGELHRLIKYVEPETIPLEVSKKLDLLQDMLASTCGQNRVESLGQVPRQWKVKRLKTSANYKVSNVDKVSKEDELPVRLCNYTNVYYHDQITPDMGLMEATATSEEISRFHLKVDDIVITKDSEDWRDIAVPAWVADTSPDLVCGYHLAIIITGCR